MNINKPIFCITSDVDWASEEAISDFISITKKFNIKPTLFTTHKSKVIQDAYDKDDINLGIHPNFLENSSHGDNYDDIIQHCVDIHPKANSFRSHSFFENSIIMQKMKQKHFLFDSNLCLYLQPNITPLNHASGITKLPVFFEDDVHWDYSDEWSLDEYFKDICLTPGLKIFNFHPILTALNVPNKEYYEKNKHHTKQIDIKTIEELRFKESGTRTFFLKLLEFISNYKENIYTLEEIYTEFPINKFMYQNPVKGRESSHTESDHNNYWNMSDEEKQTFLKSSYNSRNNIDEYATSRDFNLRELEISSIKNHISDNMKILDLGCGNGYSLISLAKEFSKCTLDGIDFSDNLIEGANQLLKNNTKKLKSIPSFKNIDALNFLESVPDNSYDIVITERFLQNMPSKDFQKNILTHIYRVLKPLGKVLLCEAFEESFKKLNTLRKDLDLSEIPESSNDNISTIRFNETEIKKYLVDNLNFNYISKYGYSDYFMISRVLHPLLVKPSNPKFDAKINSYARKIQENLGFNHGIGANSLWVFEK